MSKTFTVMPMSQQLKLEPGRVYEGEILVASPAGAAEDFYFAVEVTPYSVTDWHNTADLVTRSDQSAIVDWIEIENPTGVVAPNDTVKVRYKIKVPVDVPAGGQYATIAIRSDESMAADTGATVQNVLELASIIFSEVEGETTHAGQVVENSVPGFVTSGAPVVSTLITNQGNVHEIATVSLRVTNAVTQEVMLPRGSESAEYAELVMPGVSRYIMRELSDLPALGIYQVTQTVDYLGEVSENTTLMIACPLWFMLLVVVTVGVVLGTVAAIIAKHFRKKRLENVD